MVAEQARTEFTFGGKTKAITIEAEVLANRRDEAYGALSLRKTEVFGWTITGDVPYTAPAFLDY